MSDDDLHRLRRSMAQLAEHGGSADLYERALHTSRRLGRRRAAASSVAVAAAVLAVGVPLALMQRPPSHPTPADSPTATTAPTSTVTPEPSASSASPAGTPSSNSPSAPRPTSGDGCPVSATTLEKVAEYPAGWRIDAASIRCSMGWAVAGVIAPTPEMQGNGVIVFRYDTAAKAWKKKGEGSDIECATFDMPPSTGLCHTY